MSAISEKVRRALYAKLNVAGVTAAGATGIYYQTAPEGSVLPYLIFARVAPGRVKRVVLGGQILEDDLWQISAFADEDSDNDREPQQIAQDILIAAETAIGSTLTLTGNTVEYIKRDSDIPSMANLQNGRYIYHEGFNLRVQTS